MKLALLTPLLLVTASACATPHSLQLMHSDGRRVRCTVKEAGTTTDPDFQRCVREARKRGFRAVGAQSQGYWYQVGRRPCFAYDTAKQCEDAVRNLRARVGRHYVEGCFVRQGPRPVCDR